MSRVAPSGILPLVLATAAYRGIRMGKLGTVLSGAVALAIGLTAGSTAASGSNSGTESHAWELSAVLL